MPFQIKTNMPSDPNPRSGNAGKEAEEFDGPSHNLWVGNLSSDTSDSDLMNLFGKFGALGSVTTYAQRNYAFVYFKHLDDAKRAKDALQGTSIRGNAMKIEFARPAKPGKHLWVGGISSSVTKEQLEDEFFKFGKVEDFKFIRDRNTALVDYVRLDDAVAALKNLNGKRLGGEQLRVDYLRSHPARRENWSDFHDPRDVHFNNRNVTGYSESMWTPPDAMRNFPDSSQFGPKKHQPLLPFGVRKEAPPSNVLWIGYPPSVQIDDQMLHNAMILFGEIERIKSFASRHYSFVEFRSVDEARRAKEGLQGRLFNDPRIQILFSSSEYGSGKDNPPFFPGIRGPRPDMFFGDMPFGPMDVFGPNRPPGPNNFPAPLGPNAMPGPNMLRPFPPQGFDPILPSPDLFNDLAGFLQNFPEVNNLNNPMAGNWRRLSPPTPGMRPPPIRLGPVPGMWEGFDANPFQREPKRSRIDGPLPIDASPFHTRKMDSHGVGDPFGFGPQLDRAASGPLVNAQGPSHHTPVGARIPTGDPLSRGEHQVGPDNDHMWRGIIAKGGTPVCHARCVPMGKGVDSQLPEIVNCSARTGLDMLTKHYSEAKGFDIVFFLPDSEDDFASYTEFLRYLGVKNRAGVAKLDDGTTLFLVPPSDFLTQVLKVSGPERLYGVVLKMPQHLNSVAMQPPPQPAALPPPQSQYFNRQQISSLQLDYNQGPVKEEQTLQMDYNRVLHDDPMALQGGAKLALTHADESTEVQPVPQDYANNPAVPQPGAGVTLTPELIATLAALIPANLQPPVSGNTQMPVTSYVRPLFHAPVTTDKVMPSPGWGQEPQVSVSGSLHSGEEQTSPASQQLGHQFNNQAPILSQFSNFMNVANVPPVHSAQVQVSMGSTQVQDPGLNMQQPAVGMQQPAAGMQRLPMNMHQQAINMQQPPIHMRPVNNFMIPSQIGQFAIPQANQQYQVDASHDSQKNYGPQVDASHDSQKNYGMGHAVDGAGVFHPPVPQQSMPAASPGPVHTGNMQPQATMPLIVDKLNADLPSQVQQLQSVLSIPGQGTSESEADKNQRYQSTLQFAANLLLQIQQQQQQANAQAVQGSGSQQ